MNTPESPEQQYTSSFAGEAASEKSRAAKALAVALDVRKFEIELYWKRRERERALEMFAANALLLVSALQTRSIGGHAVNLAA